MFILKNNKGFVAFFITIVVLTVMVSVAASAMVVLVETEKATVNAKIAFQSYYAAESGL